MENHITQAVKIINKSTDKFGKIGVIVDYSDSHGDLYGVVFPNFSGSYGRKDTLTLCWFEMYEIELLKDERDEA